MASGPAPHSSSPPPSPSGAMGIDTKRHPLTSTTNQPWAPKKRASKRLRPGGKSAGAGPAMGTTLPTCELPRPCAADRKAWLENRKFHLQATRPRTERHFYDFRKSLFQIGNGNPGKFAFDVLTYETSNRHDIRPLVRR